jgi:hypothetical protein
VCFHCPNDNVWQDQMAASLASTPAWKEIRGRIFILDNAYRFSKKRKLYKKCGRAKVKDKDLTPSLRSVGGPKSTIKI